MKVPEPRKVSSGKWFIQMRLHGESVTVSNHDRKKCVREAQAIKAEYLAGKRLPPPKEKKEPTLTEAIDRYIERKSNVLSPSTIRGYRMIQKHRFQTLMNRNLSDITDADWKAACNAEAALCSAKTLTNAWRFLATVCRQECKITLPEVTLPQIVPNERPFLDADQIRLFIATAKGDRYEIPALLALSSLRRSEILGLQWENVDLTNRSILVKGAVVADEHHHFVRKEENKNRSSTRRVPILMDELYDALSAAQQDSGAVVNIAPNTLRRAVNRICVRAGVPEVGVHGLRHSFASLAYHLGVPEKITMEIGGWSDNQTMRKIYTHIAQSDMKRYEDKFSAFFANKNAN